MKLIDIIREIQIDKPKAPTQKPVARKDFYNLLGLIKNHFGDRLGEVEYASNTSEKFQYGTLYQDAISFSFFVRDINEIDQKWIYELLKQWALKFGFIDGLWEPAFYPKHKEPNTNVRVGLYPKFTTSSGGMI